MINFHRKYFCIIFNAFISSFVVSYLYHVIYPFYFVEVVSGKYEEDFEVYQSFLQTKLEEEDDEDDEDENEELEERTKTKRVHHIVFG